LSSQNKLDNGVVVMTRVALLLAVVICLALTLSAQAQPTVFKSAGPEGGVVTAIVVDPASPFTVYAATMGGGVFKSTDGASNWSRINSGLVDINISALAIARSNSQTLYAGSKSGTIYKSTNGGSTWNQVRSDVNQVYIWTIAIDPNNPNIVYVGTGGSRIFITFDGGQSWVNSSDPLLQHVRAIAIDPTNTNRIYAGNLILFRSTDRGLTWNPVDIRPDSMDITSIVLDPRDSRVIYVGSRRGDIFISTDSGAHWAGDFLELEDTEVSSLALDPLNPDTIYVGGGETIIGRPGDTGIFKSTNRGRNWVMLDTGISFPDILAIAASPSDGGAVYAGSRGLGIFKSTDQGSSWRQVNNGLIAADVRSVAVGRSNPTTIFAGANAPGLSRSTDAGASWAQVDLGVNPLKGLSIATDPADANIVYVGTPGWGLFRSTDGGFSWAQPENILVKNDTVSTLAVDQINTNIVYAGAAIANTDIGLFKSTDKGVSWFKVNSLFPRVLVADPVESNILYASIDGSPSVFKSTDGGQSWSESPAGGNGLVRSFAIDPTNNRIVYVGKEGFGVLRSTDGGASWAAAGSGLLNNGPRALAIDPKNTNVIYAAVSSATLSSAEISGPRPFNGIFRSVNSGASWTRFNPGLVNPLAFALAIDPSDSRTIYAGITGGVFKVEIGTVPDISIASFTPPKSLKIFGSGFTSSPRVVINGKDISKFIISSSASVIELKAKKKKLNLKAGENTVQVIDASGLASTEHKLFL
jgi:photosystem II stability/assembly factor-like uncharacterized protein